MSAIADERQETLNVVFTHSFVGVAVILGLYFMGIGVGGIAILAGVLGIAVGFGVQHIAKNIISGLIIIFDRRISVGDVVEIGDAKGTVKAIRLSSTTVESLTCQLVTIPNSNLLTTNVTNYTTGAPHLWIHLDVGVAYGTDTNRVAKALQDVARYHPEVLKDPEPLVRFKAFGTSSLDFSLWAAIADPQERHRIRTELRFRVEKLFKRRRITISFPQVDVHFDPIVEGTLSRLAEPPRTAETVREGAGDREGG